MNSFHYCLLFVYLFGYIQIAPAFEESLLRARRSSSALEEVKRDVDLHESMPKLVRNRRFFGAIIAVLGAIFTAAAGTVIGGQINNAIDRSMGSRPPPEQKPSIINIVINNNYNIASQLKEDVSRRDRNAGNTLRVSPSGYQCDANFCRQVGDGPSTVGICSPDICHCTNGQPVVQQCGTGTVFDPLYKVCNWPYNLKVCGN